MCLLTAVGLALGACIDLAIPPEELLTACLVKQPEDWTITLTNSNSLIDSRDANGVKTLLIQFLTKNRMPTYAHAGQVAQLLLVVCVFSMVGWIRESQIEKRQKAANHATDE